MLNNRRFLSVCVLFIMAFISFCTGISFFGVSGENEKISYKKKIVSVVFDDSGSMSGRVESIKGGKNSKYELAKYSLQFLVGLLGTNDELVIVPMNEGVRIPVDLKQTDRRNEIDSKVVNNSKINCSGWETPAVSVENALKVLEEKGLKRKDDTLQEETNVEYWLVMLTDGNFSGGKKTEDVVESGIKKYNGLNTVYLSFGDDAVDLTGEDLPLNTNYPFSAYCVRDAAKLSSAMQQVANKMSGRFGMSESGYSVEKNKVTIDLSSCNFSVNSVSVIAQDCGAVMTLATYNGKAVGVVQYSTLSDCNLSGFKEGYIGVLKADALFNGGKLEIIFDKRVDKENITIMLEPAVYIVPYLKYFNGTDWERTDMQYINSHLVPKDEIKVCYDAISAADGNKININEIFGQPVEKVTYCGDRYGIDQPIKLVKGNNTIDVSVSLMDGAFSMYASMLCCIEDNPLYYRVEGTCKTGEGEEYKKAFAVFTIFADNFPLGYEDAKNYEYEVVIVYPDGRSEKISSLMKGDGKIYAEYQGAENDFGIYKFTAKVKSKESGLTRTGSTSISFAPKTLTVNYLNGGPLEITTYRLKNNQNAMAFDIYLDGRKTSFDNNVIEYSLTVEGKTITEGIRIEEGELRFVPTEENLGEVLKSGTLKVRVTATVAGAISGYAEGEIEIKETAFEVIAASIGEKEFDRYNLSECKAAASFQVNRDGESLTKEELEELYNAGNLKIDVHPFGWITLLPCKTETVIEEINGEAYVIVKVGKSIASPFDSLIASFIFPNEKDITLTYGNSSASDTIRITPVSFFSRVWRWLVLLAILLFILHVVLYVIGFFVAKKLPKGVIVTFNLSPTNKSSFVSASRETKVNITKKSIIKWHLFRFIPFMEFKSQKSITSGVVELGYFDKRSGAEFKVKTSLVKQNKFSDGSEESNNLDSYVNSWKNYRKGSVIFNIKNKIRSGDFAGLFEESGDGTPIEKGSRRGIDGWYAEYDQKNNMKRVVTFIRCNY